MKLNNNTTTANRSPFGTTKRFLLIFIPIFILASLITFYSFSLNTKAELNSIKNQEFVLIDLQVDLLLTQWNSIISDLTFLTDHHEFKALIDASDKVTLTDLKHDYLSFSINKKIYDQIRYIDSDGMEIIRINYNSGTPYVVPKEALQQKRHRYYFKKTMELEKGKFFMSPFDLNIENMKVERPIKPAIRFAQPVFDSIDRLKGIVVLNFLGSELIEHFKEHGVAYPGEVSLVNQEGYWLAAPHSGDEWGFMLKEREEKKFPNIFSDAWGKISTEKSGQFINQQGLFTFSTIYPLTSYDEEIDDEPGATQPNADSYHWHVVSRVPSEVLSLQQNKIIKNFALLYAAILLLTTITSWLIATLSSRRLQRNAQQALAMSEQNLRAIISSVGEGIVEIDASSRILFVNEEFCNIFYYAESELIDKNLSVLMPKKYRQEHSDKISKYTSKKSPAKIIGRWVELAGLRKDGSEFPMELRVEEFTELAEEPRFTGTVRDITERKKEEEKLKNLTYIDELTGIPNRRCYNKTIQNEWNREKRGKAYLSVIMMDIDFFKLYNDTLGHIAGDNCLKIVAKALDSIVSRAGDLLARYGGEEFVIILPNADLAGATKIADKIRKTVEELEIKHPSSEISDYVTVTLGVSSIIPNKRSTPEQLVEAADKELYRAKADGRNRVKSRAA